MRTMLAATDPVSTNPLKSPDFSKALYALTNRLYRMVEISPIKRNHRPSVDQVWLLYVRPGASLIPRPGESSPPPASSMPARRWHKPRLKPTSTEIAPE